MREGTGSPGAITAYRYDGLGNLTFKGAGDESVGVYSYDPVRPHILAR